jgi:hypothetical protein
MTQSRGDEQRLPEPIDAHLSAGELEQLARVDALLREASTPAAARAAWRGGEKDTYELKLTFPELALVWRSLQAVKTLGALPPQDELLGDTMHVVDLALKRAVNGAGAARADG